MKPPDKLESFPSFASDSEAEDFVDHADLSRFDFSQFKPMQFEFDRKSAQLNMRVPQPLLEAIKTKAQSKGVPFTRYIRWLMERDVASR